MDELNRPALSAPSLTAPRDIEIWNAVMWAYHHGEITAAQGAVAMDIPAEQFERSRKVWQDQMFTGGAG